jgi:hypothetical protein
MTTPSPPSTENTVFSDEDGLYATPTIEVGGYNDDGYESEGDDISESESGSSARSKSLESENSPSLRSSSNGSSSGMFAKLTRRGKDEHRVCGARFIFFMVLLIAGVSLGAMVYTITSRDAQSDFEDEVPTTFADAVAALPFLTSL